VVVVSCLLLTGRSGVGVIIGEFLEAVVVSCLLFIGRNEVDVVIGELFRAAVVSIGCCFFITFEKSALLVEFGLSKFLRVVIVDIFSFSFSFLLTEVLGILLGSFD